MKQKILLFFILLLALSACKTDSPDAGASVLSDSDDIVVSVDTFNVRSRIEQADYIYSSPDSLLLGEADSEFGTVHADVLTQLACPVGFRWPEKSEVDSVCLYIYYSSWYGDGLTPLSIEAYYLDNGSFDYATPYATNLDLSDYWSGDKEGTAILDRQRIVVAAHPVDSVLNSATNRYIYYLRLKTTREFADHFFASAVFSSQEDFNRQINGLYITTAFGGATVLHLTEVTLAVHYSFTYNRAGKDTTVSDVKAFYANSEVRRINRISYSNDEFPAMQSLQDSINFIVSPANVYTTFSLGTGQMCDSILRSLGKKRPYVNRALLTCKVLYDPTATKSTKTRDDWARPAPYMMLVKEALMDSVLQRRFNPTDTCAIVCPLTQGTDSVGDIYYYYAYDLSPMLTKELRKPRYGEAVADSLHLCMIPVNVSAATSSSGTTVYSSVRPQQTLSTTVIRSAQSHSDPTRLEVVYSGF